MKSFFPRLLAASVGAVLLTSAYHRLDSPPVMAEAANRWLASLTTEQRARATFTFEDDERQNWHFIPIERKGLALREMTPAQKHLASALLSAGLSQQGYIKAQTVMSLEDVLRLLEKGTGPEPRLGCRRAFEDFGRCIVSSVNCIQIKPGLVNPLGPTPKQPK